MLQASNFLTPCMMIGDPWPVLCNGGLGYWFPSMNWICRSSCAANGTPTDNHAGFIGEACSLIWFYRYGWHHFISCVMAPYSNVGFYHNYRLSWDFPDFSESRTTTDGWQERSPKLGLKQLIYTLMAGGRWADRSVHLMESYESEDMNSDGLQTSADAAQLVRRAAVVVLFHCNHFASYCPTEVCSFNLVPLGQ